MGPASALVADRAAVEAAVSGADRVVLAVLAPAAPGSADPDPKQLEAHLALAAANRDDDAVFLHAVGGDASAVLPAAGAAGAASPSPSLHLFKSFDEPYAQYKAAEGAAVGGWTQEEAQGWIDELSAPIVADLSPNSKHKRWAGAGERGGALI